MDGRPMRVTIGEFASSGIESQLGTDLTEAVETAVHHYTSRLRSGRRPVAPPRFLSNGVSPDFGTGTSPGRELELSLDSDTEAILRRLAMRRGTDVDAITAHSVMIYLAELDFLSTSSGPRAL
jgi:hypothetical protein